MVADAAHTAIKKQTQLTNRENWRVAPLQTTLYIICAAQSAHSRKMWLYFAYSKHVRWVTGYIDSTTALPVGLCLFFFVFIRTLQYANSYPKSPLQRHEGRKPS